MRKLILPIFALSMLVSCSESTKPDAGNEIITIASTTGMISDIVANVTGDLASSSTIIGEGVDPHLYKPTTADVKELQDADVVFYNGMKLEGKMGDILKRIESDTKPVVAVTDEISKKSDYVLNEDEDHLDPHVWMDVKGWISAVEVVRDTMTKFDPENGSTYTSNAAAYIEELYALDDYAAAVISTIPEDQRVLVTAHDAFSYMARAYGLEVRGIQGLSTESEAGVKDIEILVEFLVEKKIPSVFVETSVSDKNIRALIEGAAAKGHTVTIGGSLFSDAMGPAKTYTGTYMGMINHNVTTIARALGGKAPARGFEGKLPSHDHPAY